MLIGGDLLIETLKRLPTKTLCRFLCVCKYWKSLISSTLFITLHKSFTCLSTPPKLKPFIQVRDNSYLMCVNDANHQDLKHEELHFPFRSTTKSKSGGGGGGGFNFVDVIQGVVCVSYSSESGFDSTILWNPAIHKYVSLPCLPFPVDLEAVKKAYQSVYKKGPAGRGRGRVRNLDLDEYLVRAKFDFSVIGFGYDTSNNVFKVVRIWIPDPDESSILLPSGYEVVVCSTLLKRRRMATAPDILKSCKLYEGSRTSCFVNGSIHWIIRTPNGRSVLMFDCKSESFRIVDLPQGIFYSVLVSYDGRTREALQKTKLMEYAGMLAVVVDYCLDHQKTDADANADLTYVVISRLNTSHFHTELWAMEEHGVAATWTKLYRFKNIISESLLLELDICRDSFVDLTYDEIVSGRVYEVSMFLMDHPKAHSYYSDEDQEQIVCKEDKTVADAKSGSIWWHLMVNHFGRRSHLPTPLLQAPRYPVTGNTGRAHLRFPRLINLR